MTAPALTGVDEPVHTHPTYAQLESEWQKIRDLGSTRSIRARGKLYLPKHAAERDDDYEVRLKLGVLYNGFKRTLSAMVGLVTQRDVTLGKDVGPLFAQHWETIDGKRRHGAVFARDVLREGLATNHAGILVDTFPVQEIGRPRSKAEEAAIGLRPYWRLYRAEDIRDWDFVEHQGEQVLSTLVLREKYHRRKGRFQTEEVTDYRVFSWSPPAVNGGRPTVTWELWREETSTSSARRASLVSTGAINGPSRIPFAFYAPAGFGEPPPLIDLADLNLTHYRTDTDRRHLMRIGCLPIPVRVGYVKRDDEPDKPWGSNILQDVPTGGNIFWAEITGAAFEVTGKDLQMIEARMGSLGLAFLQPETRAAETAEAKRIDATAQNASLASAARALQDTLEEAQSYHAAFLNIAPGSVTVNTDFERVQLDPQTVTALSALEVAGQLSLETLLSVLKVGHVLPDDVDVATELGRILKQRAASEVGGLQGAHDDGDDDPNLGATA